MADDKISVAQALQEQASGRPVDWTTVKGMDSNGAPTEDADTSGFNPWAATPFGGPVDVAPGVRATELESNEALAAAQADAIKNSKKDEDVTDETTEREDATPEEAEAVKEATPGGSADLPLLANNEAAGQPSMEATRVATGAVDADVASDGTAAPVDAEDAADADEKAAAANPQAATPDEAKADAEDATKGE